MSWHFLQGQEEASWEEKSLDGAPYALLKLIPMQDQSSLQGKEMESLNHSQSGMTSQLLMEKAGKDQLILSQVGSHAKTFHRPDQARDLQANVLDCGHKWPGLFMKFNPNTFWWKTVQCLFPEDLTSYWLTLPKWGSMLNGELSAQRIPKLHTNGSESGLWPTPRCWMKHGAIRKKTEGQWSNTTNIEDLCGGAPDPNLVEWMMDWPLGWTDLRPLETGRFQKWLFLHGNC